MQSKSNYSPTWDRIDVVNKEEVIKAFEDVFCHRVHVAQVSAKHFGIRQRPTDPPKPFDLPEGFPLCCEGHKGLFRLGVDAFSKFPDCCEGHRKLKTAAWFKKENYSYLPEKLAKSVTYTIYGVQAFIDRPDWYKDITDYIDYTVKGFGQFPEGYGAPLGLNLYLYNVEMNIENLGISQHKKQSLIKYVQSFTAKPQEDSSKIDVNILLVTYYRWLDFFPFDLNSYFGELKKYYEKHLPLIKGKVETNRFSGMSSGELHTKATLFQALLNITKGLLTEMNGASLLEKRLITDADRAQIDLLAQERRQKLKDGYKNTSPNQDHRFRKMIRDWLQDERIYWKQIAPILRRTKTESKEKVNSTFHAIDHELFTHNRVPFEIKLIYDQLCQGSGSLRWTEFKTQDYHFFTPHTLCNCFERDFEQGKLFTDYLAPLSYENVQPYFKAYGDGFLKGYNEFDTKIKASTAIFSNEEAVIKRVFAYINTPFQGLASYGSAHLNDRLVSTIDANIWFEAGVRAGENYKAWYFVINNSSYFVTLFRTYEPYIKLYHSAGEYWRTASGGEGMYSHIIKLLGDIHEATGKVETKTDNYLRSTIDDFLSPYTANMSADDYKNLVSYKEQYFEVGHFPKVVKSIHIFGKVNKKKFGWALNQLYRSQRQTARLDVEYLEFGKKNISIFKEVQFDKKKVVGCQLYKYYTTKT